MGDGGPLDAGGFAAIAAFAFVAALSAVSLGPRRVVSHARAVLVALVVIDLVAAALLLRIDPLGTRLEIDPSTEPLLPAGDPAHAFYEDAILDFGDDQVYVIVADCGDVFTVACLTTVERVTTRIARLEGVRSVKSLLDVTSFGYDPEHEWIEVRPFIEGVPEDPAQLAALREQALRNPMYRRTIVSEDARAAAINVTFHEMTDAELVASGLDAQIASILAREAAASGQETRFHVSGRPHFKAHVYQGMVRDLRMLIPLSIAVIGAVLFLFDGAVRGMALPLATGLTGVLWTFAAMAVVGRPLSLLTVLIGPSLLAIGSVYGLHVVSRYREEAQTADGPATAAARCAEHMLAPVLIAGLTTAVGFAALMITDVPAVFELGAFAVFGVASITLFALTGVPAALSLMSLHDTVRSGARVSRIADAALLRLLRSSAQRVQRHTGAVLLATVASVVVAAVAVPRIAIDTDYLSYFDPSDPVRVDFEAVNRLMSGAVPFYVVVDGGAAGSFRDPELLRAIEALQQRIEAVDGVGRTLSFLDPLRMLNRAFAADDPQQERVPDTRGEIAELLFMIPKPDLGLHLTVNHARANLIARTGEVGSAAVRGLERRITDAAREVALPGGLEPHVTSNAILLARSADGIAAGQPLSVGLAALAIFALIALGLRSPRLGLVAMIPNLLPVLIFYGLLGLGAAPLSLPTSLIGCIALGIAIDDTVHYLVRYRDERASGAGPEEAALRCSQSIGRPIAVTSMMLVLGFGAIAMSEFATLQEFGLLTAATMVVCLVNDLAVLPALLVRLRV